MPSAFCYCCTLMTVSGLSLLCGGLAWIISYWFWKCGFGERQISCDFYCESACDLILYGPNVCVERECVEGKACVCDKGYVRSPTGHCVRQWQCPPESFPRCSVNETLSFCDRQCEPQCRDLLWSHDCDFGKCRPRTVCRCKNGFHRSANGPCISKYDCFQHLPIIKSIRVNKKIARAEAYEQAAAVPYEIIVPSGWS